MTWAIKDWDEIYENAESRKIKHARWVPVLNKHEGRGFKRIAQREDRCEVFAAWILLVELASKMPKRGILKDRDGDITTEDMELKTGYPKEVFDNALKVLSDEKIGWIINDNNTKK